MRYPPSSPGTCPGVCCDCQAVGGLLYCYLVCVRVNLFLSVFVSEPFVLHVTSPVCGFVSRSQCQTVYVLVGWNAAAIADLTRVSPGCGMSTALGTAARHGLQARALRAACDQTVRLWGS